VFVHPLTADSRRLPDVFKSPENIGSNEGTRMTSRWREFDGGLPQTGDLDGATLTAAVRVSLGYDLATRR
jgi:hypothetical protein